MTEDQEGYVAIAAMLTPFLVVFVLAMLHEAGWF